MESMLGAMLFALFITAQPVAVVVLNKGKGMIDEAPSAGRRAARTAPMYPTAGGLPVAL
jgi:hypothetical protein